jgi:hypothetical protein
MPAQIGDPIEGLLPPEAHAKLRSFQDERDAAHVLLIAVVDDQQELRLDIMRGETRVKELMTPRGVGGYGLADDEPQVLAEQEKVGRKRAAQRRLASLYEVRSDAYRHVADLVRAIEQEIAARPSGCIAKTVSIETPAFKGNIIDAVEGRRRRGRELVSDLARVRAAPWPSSIAKAKMRERITQLAEAGAPRSITTRKSRLRRGPIKSGSPMSIRAQSDLLRCPIRWR